MKQKIELVLLLMLMLGGLALFFVGIVNSWIRHIVFGSIVYLCAAAAFYYWLYSNAEMDDD